jgi:hypothetical protein
MSLSPLVEFVQIGLNTAAEVAEQNGITALRQQLQAYGLSVEGLSAAASENPEAAVAGVIVGFAVTAAAAPLIASGVTTAVAASALTGTAAAAFEIGLTVATEVGISTGTGALTSTVLNALADALNTQATATAIGQAFAAYGNGEIENAQLEMQQADALINAAGQALSSVGESLYSDIKSIGTFLGSAFSVSPVGGSSEALLVNAAGINGTTSLSQTISAASAFQSGLADETSGASVLIVPSAAGSQLATDWSGANGGGTLTGEAIQSVTSGGAAGDQIQINLGSGSNPTTAAVSDSNGNLISNYSLSGTANIQLANGGSVVAGSGPTIVIDPGTGAALSGTSSQDLFIDLSNGGSVSTGANTTVFVGGDDTTITNSGSGCTDGIHCAGDIVNGSTETVTEDNGSSLTVNGNSDGITGGTNDGLTVTGSLDTATLGIDGTVVANGASDVITAGATSVVSAFGNDDTATVGASSQLSLSGNDDIGTVPRYGTAWATGAGDTLTLFGTLTEASIGATDIANESGTGDIVWATGTNAIVNLYGTTNTADLMGSGETAYAVNNLGTVWANCRAGSCRMNSRTARTSAARRRCTTTTSPASRTRSHRRGFIRARCSVGRMSRCSMR